MLKDAGSLNGSQTIPSSVYLTSTCFSGRMKTTKLYFFLFAILGKVHTASIIHWAVYSVLYLCNMVYLMTGCIISYSFVSKAP